MPIPKIVAFDTETHLVQPGCLTPKLVCLQYYTTGDHQVLTRGAGLQALERWLRDGCIFVGHNIAYDFAVACAAAPHLVAPVFAAYAAGLVRDTGVRGMLADIRTGTLGCGRPGGKPAGYSLAALLLAHNGADRRDAKTGGWRLRYGELDNIPVKDWPAEAVQYALNDPLDTYWLAWKQSGTDNMDFWDGAPVVNEVEQVRAAWALHLASVWGMRTDAEAVQALDTQVSTLYAAMQRSIEAVGLLRRDRMTKADLADGKTPAGYSDDGKPYKLVKNQAVIREAVKEAFTTLGLKYPLTDKGSVSTNADAMARTGVPALMELGAAGPIGTTLHTFVPALKLGTEYPINTRYRELVSTGRISSSAPNLNNIPRTGGVRECYRPRPGFVFLAADYNCAELRALAQICLRWFGQSVMAAMFQKDPYADPHLMLAASRLGLSYAEAMARIEEPQVKKARQLAKALNFGFPGGLGVAKMVSYARVSWGATMTLAEAQAGKNAWFQQWPEMRLYLSLIGSRVGDGTAAIRQFHPTGKPHRIRGGVGFCDGANTMFQGLIADVIKDAAWEVSREAHTCPSSPLWGSHLVGCLYDELLLETPIAGATAAADRLERRMVEAAHWWMPDVPATVKPTLMDRWSKRAESRRLEDGTLTVWTP